MAKLVVRHGDQLDRRPSRNQKRHTPERKHCTRFAAEHNLFNQRDQWTALKRIVHW